MPKTTDSNKSTTEAVKERDPGYDIIKPGGRLVGSKDAAEPADQSGEATRSCN